MVRRSDRRDGVPGWRCRKLYAAPGRVRLERPRWTAAEADLLIAQLRAHSMVHDVRLSSRSLTVTHDPAVAVEVILATLPSAGMVTTVATTSDAGSESPSGGLWRRFLTPTICVAAALSGTPAAGLVVAACSMSITRRALSSLMRGRLSIDVLDAVAVSLLLASGDILAAGVSVGLIETGERIRSQASGRARRVLRSWMGADAYLVRILDHGSEPRIAATLVQLGDRIVVYAGETIPVDGIVVAGTASVDNRTWTGEPYPVAVTRGSSVLAGSAVSDGRLVIEVRATGESTRAGRLARALEDAIAADTRVSDLARRLADRFVAPTFLLGGAVFAISGDLSRLISLLIVDFGTGIRIAVPTSILTTMIAAARSDVLFRSGQAIEALAAVDTIVFDKTGTLTTGHPSIIAIETVDGWSEPEVLRYAAAAEGHLQHPIARAVRRHARRHGLELPSPDDVRHHHGGGVVARIGGRAVLVGSARLLADHDIEPPAPLIGESSVILVAVDGGYVGRLQLRDRLKTGINPLIAAVRAQGVTHIRLATGDRLSAARSVARHLGLDGYDAAMLPEDKRDLVVRLRAQGRKVAVVGDGINDAAAMAEADVGIAVHDGAELARETADVVLTGDDLSGLVTALRLSREAMGLVRQNIGVVALPNAVALGFAAAGLLPPLAATAANNGSTLLAGLNALRPLRNRRPR